MKVAVWESKLISSFLKPTDYSVIYIEPSDLSCCIKQIVEAFNVGLENPAFKKFHIATISSFKNIHCNQNLMLKSNMENYFILVK